jgi:hypothetical protein
MSSVVSQLAQIPRGSHFRPIPSLVANAGLVTSSVFTFTADSGVAPRLTYNSQTVGVTGSFAPAPWVVSGAATAGGYPAHGALSSGAAILKDLGETIVSSGRTFRRVQLLASGVSTTEQNFGTYSGADSDALCGYIEVGFRGTGAPGPFIRAY